MTNLVARLGGRDIALDSAAVVNALVDELSQSPTFDLAVTEKRGEERGGMRILYKLLGLSTSMDVTRVLLQRADAQCRLIFLTSAGSEHRAYRPERAGDFSSVTLRFEDGDSEVTSAAECLSVEDAVRATHEYVSTRKRPAWLSYRNVR